MNDQWLSMTPEELVKQRSRESAGTPDAIAIDRIIELKIARSQADASDKLLTSTDKLVNATHRLGTVTWWLVAGTFLLGISAAVDVIFKIIKGAH